MVLVVTHKDVVVAILGASSALSGLVLVFLGLVMAASDFAPGTKKAIVQKAREPATSVLVSFGLGVACLAAAVTWLLYPRLVAYWITVGFFAAQLVSLVVATAWVVRRTLWG